MSWVVVVKPPDDYPAMIRIFGPYHSKIRAQRLASRVRAAVDDLEQQQLDDRFGYAWVVPLESGANHEGYTAAAARLWATRGER